MNYCCMNGNGVGQERVREETIKQLNFARVIGL